MSDQVPGSPAPPQEGGQQPTPDTITRAEAQRLAAEAAEAAFRRAQGLIDKGSGKIADRLSALEEHFRLQEQVGVPLTPETRQKMRNQVLDEMTPKPSAPAAQPQAGQQGDPYAAVNDAVVRLQAKHQTSIEQTDPEAATLMTAVSPGDFILKMDDALQAKKARLAKPPAAGERPPEARISGLGAGAPPVEELFDEYLKEVQKYRPGSEEVMQIRRKYRDKGLNL